MIPYNLAMEKIGRNDPCPCGSGKKHKQCCFRNVTSPTVPASSSSESITALFQHAVEHHQSGRLAEAESGYRRLLQLRPRHADALHLLGVIALQRGQHAAAVDLIRQALKLKPSEHYYSNLGNALKALGAVGEAIRSYRAALQIQPELAEAHCNLGNALFETGEIDEAIACSRKAILLKPDLAAAHSNLGNAFMARGDLDQAVACYQRTLVLQPNLAEAHSNLGNVLSEQNQLEAAIASCRRAIQVKPDFAAAYSHLGTALGKQGRLDEAVINYRRALSFNSRMVDVHGKLAQTFRKQGRPEAAVGSSIDALQLRESQETRQGFVDCIKDAHFQSPNPQARHFVMRAVAGAWARPGDLLTPAKSLIELNPGVKASLERAEQEWPRQLSERELFGDTGLALVADDPLFQCLLEGVAINDRAFERLLTMVRKNLLDAAMTAMHSGDSSWSRVGIFYSALARQCFINEYVYACTDDESAQVALLRAGVTALMASGAPVPALCLVALAAYAPLTELAGVDALFALSWPDAVVDLLTQQVTEPCIEQGYRASIPLLTEIDGGVSRLVQAQYEENPYPRWVRVPKLTSATSVDALIRHQFPAAPFLPLGKTDAVDILIAGCGTGQHSIQTAQQFKGAKVLAIDLSLASLCYARRKTEELGLCNIAYAQADILNLGALKQGFDLIESSGVLHHLDDPEAGLQALLGLLRPGGLMCLGLYSEIARKDVVAARAVIARRGYLPQAADIRRCRQELMADDQAAQFAQFLSSRDFYAMSDCRDLLFHVQEHRFTLPLLRELLAEAGLRLIGFMLDPEVAAKYAKQFPDDPARTNFDHWQAFETENPDTFARMYQFWVQKPLK